MNKVLLAIAVLLLSITGQSWAGDAAAGKAKSAQCAACHGVAGISPMGIYPNLAGQKEQYLVKQINNFRSGVRKDPSMQAMVSALTDDDVANLAAYYAGIK
ncbi:MAG: cytochrome c553 [Cycloclasticus pugetii]|jgi:cytochrome c553|uniref:Cytochrome c, class I n=2 Tax=Cycloclasticus TaxID=34067 RepID=S5U004_9GAMM|nr:MULTISPECIES: cytochrome c [Cycloclasticus]AFT66241.1 Cytochrome c, class I [Cycloclasticus sp. P1]AGS40795.1 Cytochrome c, class I [Cycloclasticus zancles 78-ME]ATI01984.1 cytochrome c [Cycloclasticus sp. PY97N]EPD13274.1 cytochrome c, class I [Cycloclasticus pugetii]MBV1899337.1 cytochrome c [Cycloclasticus sp.]|tara:strand:- start:1708 stop:2010 length:303 start_codon:yes stop_codon:yes gene_type:complete